MGELSAFDITVSALSLLLILLAVLHRRIPYLHPLWRVYRVWVGPLMIFLVCLVLGLGVAFCSPHGDTSRVVHAIHLLKLDLSVDLLPPVEQVTRGLAVLLWVILGIELNRRLVFRSLHVANLIHIRDHIVICGLGEVGMRMVRDLTASHRSVVVIEQDADSAAIDDAEERGATVLIGNAMDDEVLRQARVHAAAEVFALTGSDASNATVVAQVRDLTEAWNQRSRWKRWFLDLRFRPLNPLLCCFASIGNPQLADAAKRLRYPASESDREARHLSVQFVVPEMIAATQLLRQTLLPELPAKLNGRVPHFVIVGFGQQGQAVAMMIAQLVHLENEKRCRLTILHRTDAERDDFLRRYPAFCPAVREGEDAWQRPHDADLWNDRSHHAAHHLRSPDANSPGVSFVCNAGFELLQGRGVDDRIAERTGELLRDETCLPLVVYCLEQDAANLLAAQSLFDKLQGHVRLDPAHPWAGDRPGMPICIQLWEHEGLLASVAAPPSWANKVPPVSRLIPFGKAGNVLSHNTFTHSDALDLAYRIFAAYELFYSDKKRDWNSVQWNDLIEFDASVRENSAAKQVFWQHWFAQDFQLQYSNIAAALHSPFKLRVMGFTQTPKGTDASSSPLPALSIDRILFEQLGRVEHNRWIAERLMNGWRYAPENKQENDDQRNARRERKQLVACEDLREILKDNYEKEFFKDLMQYECVLRHYNIPYSLAEDLDQHIREITQNQTPLRNMSE